MDDLWQLNKNKLCMKFYSDNKFINLLNAEMTEGGKVCVKIPLLHADKDMIVWCVSDRIKLNKSLIENISVKRLKKLGVN